MEAADAGDEHSELQMTRKGLEGESGRCRKSSASSSAPACAMPLSLSLSSLISITCISSSPRCARGCAGCTRAPPPVPPALSSLLSASIPKLSSASIMGMELMLRLLGRRRCVDDDEGGRRRSDAADRDDTRCALLDRRSGPAVHDGGDGGLACCGSLNGNRQVEALRFCCGLNGRGEIARLRRWKANS